LDFPRALAAESRQARRRGEFMSFVLGLIVFVVVIGILDARLPWSRS
jgi:hypothetical protein